MIRIVTDSTCDLPEELLVQHRITVVPINVQFREETYQERVNLSEDAFYRKVAELNTIPQTSQPSVGQFRTAYDALGAEAATEAILSIHLTSHLSGTCSSATIAATQMAALTEPPRHLRRADRSGPPITVFDSLSGSMGLGFMVLEAVQLAEAGAEMAAIVSRLETIRQRMRIFFSLDDLRYARMSGRVGMAQALIASLLSVKPMLTVQAGRLALVGRVRTRTQALRTMVGALVESFKDEEAGNLPARVAVIHAQAPEAAAQVREAIESCLRTSEVLIHGLSIGIAVHFGPGTVGVVGYNP